MMKIRIKATLIACTLTALIPYFQNKIYSQTDSVVINYQASSATTVKVVCKNLNYFLGSDTINLVKGSNSVWKKTIKNVPAGFYYYRILVNEAPVYDRASFAYLGLATWVNAFEISGADSFSNQKTGPFGNINENYYKSISSNDFNRCFVYTPAEYDANPGKNYPVVYLLNDSGEDESAWIYQGKINNIMDNAINKGEIEPMLVVLTHSNISDSSITSDLIPYIDSIYHTLDSTKYRAVAGCGWGSLKAEQIASGFPDKFSNLGIFSISAGFDTSQSFVDSIKAAGLNVLYVGAGTSDSTYASCLSFHQKLNDSSVTHFWDASAGSFNWLVWRKNFYNMLKILFK
jgi:enterochelin esterase-like enzyme